MQISKPNHTVTSSDVGNIQSPRRYISSFLQDDVLRIVSIQIRGAVYYKKQYSPLRAFLYNSDLAKLVNGPQPSASGLTQVWLGHYYTRMPSVGCTISYLVADKYFTRVQCYTFVSAVYLCRTYNSFAFILKLPIIISHRTVVLGHYGIESHACAFDRPA